MTPNATILPNDVDLTKPLRFGSWEAEQMAGAVIRLCQGANVWRPFKLSEIEHWFRTLSHTEWDLMLYRSGPFLFGPDSNGCYSINSVFLDRLS